MLFGGFRIKEDAREGFIVIDTETREVEEFKDENKDLYYYYEGLWAPYKDGKFYAAKNFDYQLRRTDFAGFMLSDEDN